MTNLNDWEHRATQLLGTTRQATRPRGFAPWTPREETKSLLKQIDAVLREYVSYLPTIRQVFYRLVGAHGYQKTEARPAGPVGCSYGPADRAVATDGDGAKCTGRTADCGRSRIREVARLVQGGAILRGPGVVYQRLAAAGCSDG